MSRHTFALGLLLSVSTLIARADSLPQLKQQFQAQDQSLNQVYQEAKRELPDWRFEDLQADQRDWLEYRDARAASAAHFDGGAAEGEEQTNPEYWRAMAYLTESRTEIVRGWILMGEFSGEWGGVWSDGRGAKY